MHKQVKQIAGWFSRARMFLFVLIFSLLLLGSVIYRFVAQNNWLEGEFKAQIQNTQLNQEIAALNLYIKNAESADRGYAISGNPEFVRNFDTSIDSIRSIYLEVQQLENRNIDHADAALFLRSDSLIQQKIAFMKQVKSLCDNHQYKIAADLIASNEGLHLSDTIAGINKQISNNIHARLQTSQTGFLKVTGNNNNLAYTGIGVAMLLIVLSFYFLMAAMRKNKKISKELLVRKQFYQTTLSSLSEGLIVTDKEGYIEYINAAAEQLTGWRWQDAKKQPLHTVFDVLNEETGKPFENIVSRVLEYGTAIGLENNTLLKTKDAGTFIISNNGAPLFDVNGQISGAVLLFNDITEKHKIENQLKDSEEKYRSLIEQASDAILIYSFDGTIHEFNKSCYTILGYTAVEYAKLRLADILVDEIIVNQDNYAAILAGETPTLYRNLMRKDGTLLETEVTVKMLADGKVIAFARDITERKKAEKFLKESEAKYRSLVEQAADGIFVFNQQGNVLSANTSGCRMVGYEMIDLLKMNLQDITPAEYYGKQPIKLSKVNEGGPLLVERQIIRKDGSIFLTEVSVQILADKNIQVIVRDITKRKKAEQALKESEKDLRTLAESMPQIVWITHADGWNIYFNQQWMDYTGLTLEESLGRGWNKPFHPDDQQRAWDAWQNAVTNLADYRLECRLRKHDGTYHWWLIRGVPQIGDNGEIIKWHGTCTDIEQIKKQEEIIKKEKELSDSVINSLPGVFYFYDENLKLLRWNKQLENVTGYSAAELNAMNPAALFTGEDRVYMQERSQKVFASGSGDSEASFTTKSGKKIPFYFTGVRMQYEDKPTLLGIGIDITERKNAELITNNAIERYDILADATSDTIWDWDIVNNTMLYNDGISKMFGYNTSEVENVFDWWNDKLHSEDFQKVTDVLEDVFEKKMERLQLQYRFRCADGSYKHIFDRAFVIFDNEGKPTRMIGAMQDITYQSEEELRIAKATLDAQEAERNSLGAELHDNINQILTGTLLTLGMAKSKEVNATQQTKYISSAMGYIKEAINETRKLSHSLAPASFEDNSLKDLFENLLATINLEKLFTVKLDFDEIKETVIPENIQVNLYRILQEQTKNILKYAEASTIEITVKIIDNAVRLRIYDNGKGFDVKTKKSGIGLSNIKKRAESLRGKFFLHSAPGKGCEIIVEIPLVNESDQNK